MSSSTLPSSSNHMKCDITSSFSNQIDTVSPPTCYLIVEAKVNDIRGLVLLDAGSGLTIISFQHWSIIGDKSSPLTPYTGPDIHGPEGSSICPVGWVTVDIAIAGIIIQHKTILAKNFKHLILIGNDLMKNIGIVLDIQANKMWLRTKPNLQYDISSDLSNAGRLDVPLLSTQLCTIPPYCMAFIQVKTPSSISSVTWEASVSGVHRDVIAANSLVRIQNQYCTIQVANCCSKSQVIYPGQHFGTADLYDSENDDTTLVLPITSLSTTSTLPCNIVESSDQIYCSTQVKKSSNNNNSITLNSLNFLTELNLTDSDLTLQQTEKLKSLLVKYDQCFENRLGRTSLVHHQIDTGNTKPIKLRPYRVSPVRKEIISTEITKMLNEGIIEPCNSPYAAPITLQPKKDGSLRFSVDFRELNGVTVRDFYPIPRIDHTLDQLQHAKYFTLMDLCSGLWQIELDPTSQDKAAFRFHAGLFRFRVMPFGLTNAPTTFQCLMDLVLDGLK
ncbi:unnamed protein product [Rotaria magnacalcarata]|uniref:Uncharacterized protein n=1 Tax=Rotaria magnacalcarata TaxID=392030 RepID=A0A8S2V9N1_9BILA|nr:unnamed protein product [Rotaria magnacalcarata]